MFKCSSWVGLTFVGQAARGPSTPPAKPVLEDDEVRASPLSPPVARPSSSPSSSPPASPRRSNPSSLVPPVAIPAQPAPSSPRMSPVVVRAPSAAPATLAPVRGPSTAESVSKTAVIAPSSPKQKNVSTTAFDSDLDEGSVSEKEMLQVHSTLLTQMSGAKFSDEAETPPPPLPSADKPVRVEKPDASSEQPESASKRSRLEKSRGSISLPKRGNSEGKAKEEATPSPVQRQGTLRGLLARLKRDGDEEEEEREMVISSPMNVQHEKHVGSSNLESDLVKVFPNVDEKKSASSPAGEEKKPAPVEEKKEKKSRPKSSKLFATLRGKPKESSSSVEEELQITGPTEVQHQGHVDVAEAKATSDVVAVVADAIDSVKNKEKPVDTDIFVEEIKFAEAYEP